MRGLVLVCGLQLETIFWEMLLQIVEEATLLPPLGSARACRRATSGVGLCQHLKPAQGQSGEPMLG